MEDRREGRRRERQETSLRKNGLYFSALFTFSSELKFICRFRLFGALGPAGLARVGLQTLYIVTTQPLMHINLVILKALGKLTRTFIQNSMETFRVSVSFNAQQSTAGLLFNSIADFFPPPKLERIKNKMFK